MSMDSRAGREVPFLTVASKGGPHDDESYAAGYEMGGMDAMLKALAPASALMQVPMTIRSVNRRQADLIAMKHGFTIEDVEWIEWVDGSEPDPEWSTIVVRRNSCGGNQ